MTPFYISFLYYITSSGKGKGKLLHKSAWLTHSYSVTVYLQWSHSWTEMRWELKMNKPKRKEALLRKSGI